MRVAKVIDTPVGELQLVASENALCEINWAGCHRQMSKNTATSSAVLEVAAAELGQYFMGTITTFSVRCAPAGTAFQRVVWSSLTGIHWGQTRTYKDIAQDINKPKGARAVGTAIGKNPLPIVIPCHRVVGTNGALTGFSGGLETKRALLTLEHFPGK